MNKINLKKMEVGTIAEGYVLILNIEEKKTKAGKPYVEMNISDGTDTCIAKEWDTSIHKVERFIKAVGCVTISCQSYNGNKDCVIGQVKEPEEDVKVTDFIKKAPLASEDMYNTILDMVKSTVKGSEENSLYALVKNIYEKNKDVLYTHGAASGVHHNYYGGLLYHTYRMVKAAKALLTVYDGLDAELLVAATALHDIGKLKELETDEFGSSTYSVDGQLFGHALLGIEMINEEANSGHYSEEKIKCLKHCIASHHGQLDWGAVTVPHIKEAAVLHLIDMLDSRIEIFDKAEENVAPGTMSDEKIRALNNISVYVQKEDEPDILPGQLSFDEI